MPDCTACRHPIDDGQARGRACCRRCADQLTVWLREIPHHLVLLRDILRPEGAPAQGSTVAAIVGRSPVRDDVLNLLGPAGPPSTGSDPHGDQTGPPSIDSVLCGWARVIAQDLGCTAPALHPGGTWHSWLLAYLPWAVCQGWVGEMHAELGALVGRVRGITYTEPRRRPRTAPCSCGAFALVAEDYAIYTGCEACGLLYTEQEYQQHRAVVMPVLARAALSLVVRAAGGAGAEGHAAA